MKSENPVEQASTTEGLPVSPSLGPALDASSVPAQSSLVDRRVVFISLLSILVALMAGCIAQLLVHLIWLITNISFHQTFSFAYGTPPTTRGDMHAWMIFVPVIGGVIVGFMARYGHKAIRGHGIPEAMEQVLLNESRIPPRMTFLKPLSAAIAIGTGGPFGAEGPIIATGGALGSLVGQVLATTAIERKTLLAAGAAAGMAATFGSPVSAVLLAIELLLFEFRPRSLIPVALAAATAAGVRVLFDGVEAGLCHAQSGRTRAARRWPSTSLLGAVIGVVSVVVTRAVYWVEDAFEHLPIHWMWWPAHRGGRGRALCGYFAPRTLGVGYSNIADILSGHERLDVSSLFLVRDEIHLLVDRAGQRHLGRHAGAAVHHRRRAGRGARHRRCSICSRMRDRSARRGAGRHGRDVRRRVARAAGSVWSSRSRRRFSRWACCRCWADAPRRSWSRAC